MKKNLCFIALFLVYVLSSACPSWGEPVTLTQEIEGEKVTTAFDSVPERAVSLSHFSTEMMLALGLKDKMAGTAFLEEPISSKVAEDYAKVPVLADKWPTLEVFMAARPDFAIGWASAFSKKGVEAQNVLAHNVKIFIPLATVKFDADLDTLFEDFMILGRIFNIEERAKAWVDSEKSRLESIKAKIGTKPSKKIFIYDSGDSEPFTVYEGFTTNLFRLVGAENVLAGKGVNKTWGKANWEEIIAADPDAIVVIAYNESIRNPQTDAASKIEWFKNNPLLQNMKAVKNNSFVEVSLADICPGIRNVDVLEKLSAAIHGDK